MKTITIEHETDTAHRLSCHMGKCKNLHGHRYKFVISVKTEHSIENPGFIDFYVLKQGVRDVLNFCFDHGTILCDNAENEQLIKVLQESKQKVYLMQKEPTVEAMIDEVRKFIFQGSLNKLKLHQLTIYETPTNYCTWTEDK